MAAYDSGMLRRAYWAAPSLAGVRAHALAAREAGQAAAFAQESHDACTRDLREAAVEPSPAHPDGFCRRFRRLSRFSTKPRRGLRFAVRASESGRKPGADLP